MGRVITSYSIHYTKLYDRPKLVEAVRSEEVLGALYRLSTTVEDTLAAGATLEEAAKTNKLSIHVLDGVDAEGGNLSADATIV